MEAIRWQEKIRHTSLVILTYWLGCDASSFSRIVDSLIIPLVVIIACDYGEVLFGDVVVSLSIIGRRWLFLGIVGYECPFIKTSSL